MALKPRDIASFVIGAAAGAAIWKYASMTPEEREKMFNDMKDKANDLKEKAGDSFEDAKDYFFEWKEKGADFFNDNWAEVESYLYDLFKGKSKAEEFVHDVADDVEDVVHEVDSKAQDVKNDIKNKVNKAKNNNDTEEVIPVV